MREKYESLSVAVLRDLAKSRGIAKVSTMKKAELIEAMVAEDEKAQPASEDAKNIDEKKKETTEEKNETRQHRYPRQQNGQYHENRKNDGRDHNLQNEVDMSLDSGITTEGILEVMPDGYGFIRCENYMPGENDVYVAPSQIRRFGLKTGDILKGNKRIKTQQEKFSALLFVKSINGYTVEESSKRMAFEDMTPIFPDERIKMETPGCSIAMRVMDLSLIHI